jgi:hypothetical protein
MKSIPASEINWLYGLDKKYKTPINRSIYTVYSVNLLPPILKEWVYEKSPMTQYINMSPSMGTSDGLIWSICGWDSHQKDSGDQNANWHDSICADVQKTSPEIDWLYNIQIKHKLQLADGNLYSFYPVDVLPPNLKTWVKMISLDTEYIYLQPIMDTPSGMLLPVWGWESLPYESGPTEASWHECMKLLTIQA